jgi:hypothetical protein
MQKPRTRLASSTKYRYYPVIYIDQYTPDLESKVTYPGTYLLTYHTYLGSQA